MAKKMPRITNLEGSDGDQQTLYEVTSSGIFQKWEENVSNSNRFRDSTEGRSTFRGACNNSNCFSANQINNKTFANGIMCGINEKGEDVYNVCDPIYNDFAGEYLRAESNLTSICTGSKYHTCSTEGNYGTITVDFDTKVLRLSIQTPNENEEAEIEIPYF